MTKVSEEKVIKITKKVMKLCTLWGPLDKMTYKIFNVLLLFINMGNSVDRL